MREEVGERRRERDERKKKETGMWQMKRKKWETRRERENW